MPLQFNHRCPVCRHDQREKKAEADDDDLYEDGYIDRCENIVHAKRRPRILAFKIRFFVGVESLRLKEKFDLYLSGFFDTDRLRFVSCMLSNRNQFRMRYNRFL